MKNKHNEELGSEIERSNERIDLTGEVFTPIELCNSMIDEISEENLKNPNSVFLDPTAGNGNFLVALKTKLLNYHTEDHILNHMLYSVELMSDNHKEMCDRLGVSTEHSHYVCDDALRYHYVFNGTFSKSITLDNFFSLNDENCPLEPS
jgi:hypothetical protein